ncbi:MAG: GTP cyclohydrolase [Flavobacterium sp.]|jgi:GNAT superfamily N-acetyltransferase|uniref:GTP cyclohydrolase n=1 Tax=Flavobacterium sp. TaxID=239 RepID=UPI000DB4220C|nr:GTP cyclohydrolase [Flavobacterium sp.]MCZ8090606.1 GTP cyclohydrolase [Flavobacterium sp.]MCZ8330583.1 GTP cyclohydrolase [Flavobacterium sp.]PZO30913.1 MAG: GTP cyclohydrolase [Flavobacteriaceae bacterium]
MITIVEANSKQLLKDFVKFPFELYKNHPFWVPPLIADEMETFDKDKNPAFKSAEAYFYLAYKNNKIVGRIAAIINWNEVKEQQKSKVRFGWWETIDDVEVTKALLEKVYELGRKNNLEHVEGPMGFSNLDKVGVMTEGFEEMGSMITWYNYPYYASHLEKLGYVKEKEYLENKFPFENVKPEFFLKAQELIKKRYQLRPLNFTKTKDIMPFVDQMFDLFNKSYASLSSFVAITDIQKEYFKKKYISFINPEYIKFVLDKDDQIVAFSIVMPSFSEALRKANGKLFPFGFYHLLQARKNSKDVLFYLIGVDPEYQSKGVTAIIFNEYYNTFTEKGIKNCIRTPELADNHAIHNIWKHFNPEIFRRRCTFKKNL